MSIADTYFGSKLGLTVAVSYNANTGAVVQKDFAVDLPNTLYVNFPTPSLWVMRSTTDCRVAQIPSDQSVVLTAGGTYQVALSTYGFLLFARTYWPLATEGLADSRFTVISDTTSSGTLFLTLTSQLIRASSVYTNVPGYTI